MEQEVLRCSHEGAAVSFDPTTGDDAMHVRVPVEGLAPGVQDDDDAELGVPEVVGEGLQGVGGHAEQQSVEQHGVVKRQCHQRFGQGEDEVEVLDRQQLLLACLDPQGALEGAALGAVAVAAGVVADLDMVAVVALIDVAAEGAGATARDVAHRPVLLGTELVLLAVGVPVAAEDVRDLVAGPRAVGVERGLDLVCEDLAGHSDSLADAGLAAMSLQLVAKRWERACY